MGKCRATKNCPGFVRAETREADLAYYKNQIKLHINGHVRKYYRRTYQCVGAMNPANCPYISMSRRTLNLKTEKRCPCGGTMRESFSAAKLNRQIDYFMYLFDKVKADTLYQQKSRMQRSR